MNNTSQLVGQMREPRYAIGQAVYVLPRDRFCNKADSPQQHRHLSRSIDYSDKGCPLYYEKLLPTVNHTVKVCVRYWHSSLKPEPSFVYKVEGSKRVVS